MKAIYSSKLFRSSSRKDKIKAAIENPLNSELVQQLREYLDDEYVSEEYLDPNSSDDVDNIDTGNKSSEEHSDSSDRPAASGSRSGRVPTAAKFHPSSPNPGVDEIDDISNEDDLDSIEPNDIDDVDDTEGDTSPKISESVTVSNTKVNAQTVLYSPPIIPVDALTDVVEELKGTLNMRDDTAGVNRVLCKENSELWIYYNDNINLNNIMGPVIELINSAGYTYLDFNRLARSDNAIVFQISIADSNSSVKPIGSDGDA